MAIRVNGVTVAGGYTATTGSGLPDGGTPGQLLSKTENGAEWVDKPVVYVNVSDNTSDISSSEINQYISDGYAVFVVTNLKGQTFILPLTRDSGNSAIFALFIGDRIINCHISDTTATVSEVMLDASRVQFDPGTSGLAADNAQDAIEELAGKSGMTQDQADQRYLQLSGGTMPDDSTGIKFPLNESNPFAYAGDGVSYYAGIYFTSISDAPGVTIVASNTRPDSPSANPSLIVSTDGIIAPSYTINKIVNPSNLTTKEYVDSKSPKSKLVTLTTAGWSSNSQTVTVNGVLADEASQLIQPVPAIASMQAYMDAGILCTNQAANSLTFTCSTVPTTNISVYIVMQSVTPQ